MSRGIWQADKHFISRCLALAHRGEGFVSPNPLVGCVLVKNGRIIAEGCHKKFGGDHAEIDALKKVAFKAKGATLYCNLEPCFHQGKTPPCINTIIRSGVTRVVIAMRDPNPLVAGKSIRLLKKSGLRVTVGVLFDAACFLNRAFVTWITKKRPYVILKMAMSRDGRISVARGSWLAARGSRLVARRQWITGPKARRHVHEIRKTVDAILVGVNTVIDDDPLLTVRLRGRDKTPLPRWEGMKGRVEKIRQPLRVILDSRLRFPLNSRIFRLPGGPVILATCSHRADKIKKYEKKGITLLQFSGKKIPLGNLLKKLASIGVGRLLVEGGAHVFESFYRARLFDEIDLFVSPKIIGKGGLKMDLSSLRRLTPKEIHYYKPDILFVL